MVTFILFGVCTVYLTYNIYGERATFDLCMHTHADNHDKEIILIMLTLLLC